MASRARSRVDGKRLSLSRKRKNQSYFEADHKKLKNSLEDQVTFVHKELETDTSYGHGDQSSDSISELAHSLGTNRSDANEAITKTSISAPESCSVDSSSIPHPLIVSSPPLNIESHSFEVSPVNILALTPVKPTFIVTTKNTSASRSKLSKIGKQSSRLSDIGRIRNNNSQTTLDSFIICSRKGTPNSNTVISTNQSSSTPVSSSLCSVNKTDFLGSSHIKTKNSVPIVTRVTNLCHSNLQNPRSQSFNNRFAGYKKGTFNRQNCPSFKWIPGTGFTVDAFCYGSIPNCSGYFLSHFHSDHYMGLSKHFKHKLYCSKITSNLVCQQLRVPPTRVHHLPMNELITIDGVTVTLLEANHCPGSVMFLFKLPDGKRILHTGDFRATPFIMQLIESPIDTVYLDTTYCSSRYDFPSQDSVMQFVVDVTLKFLVNHPNALIICGTYTIGKEKIFQAIAEVLNCKVYVNREKKRIIDCLESKVLSDMCISSDSDPFSARIHVMPINKMNPQELLHHLSMFNRQYSSLLAFKPTGWTHRSSVTSINNIRPRQHGPVTIYGVPYSEHSSYSELRDFVQHIKPNHVISTVGRTPARTNATLQCTKWLNESTTKKPTQATLDSIFDVRTK